MGSTIIKCDRDVCALNTSDMIAPPPLDPPEREQIKIEIPYPIIITRSKNWALQ